MSPKTNAFVDLVRRLEAGEILTAARIAERYGVTRRTAQRWMAEAEEFLPVKRIAGKTLGRKGRTGDVIGRAE